MDKTSPLRFLNYDVSIYLYDTYFPDNKSKGLKILMNNEFKRKINTYTTKYEIDNIYEIHLMFCIRGCLYKPLSFFTFLNKKTSKRKIINNYLHIDQMGMGHRRAIKYKQDSQKYKTYTNHVT
jgi:hypothetical protein